MLRKSSSLITGTLSSFAWVEKEQIKEHNPLAVMTALQGYFPVCFER
jgi:hypothetical protein